jgi:hypothetical protein
MWILFIIFAIVVVAIWIYASSMNAESHETTQAKLAAKMYGDQSADDAFDLSDDIERMKRMTEAMIQAKAAGHDDDYEAIMNGTYRGPLPEPRDDGGYLSIYDDLRILKIAGINYRQGIIRYMGRVMSALVPEPANEFDPNAIKIVADDRHHLGYIPTNQTDFVRSLTEGSFPYRCECHIYQAEDEDDGHKFFYGFVYIKRKDRGE